MRLWMHLWMHPIGRGLLSNGCRFKGMTHYNDDTDEDLIAHIQNGRHQAFAVLVQRHTDRFYGLAWRLLNNDAEADDVVQDAFLKLWTRPDLFRREAQVKFTTWFYRVVSNLALDKLRTRKRWAGDTALAGMIDQSKIADQSYEDKQMQDFIAHAVAALPERQRLALSLCFYEGVSVAEAAQIIGVGEKAVESLLMRAKSGLRAELIRQNILSPTGRTSVKTNIETAEGRHERSV